MLLNDIPLVIFSQFHPWQKSKFLLKISLFSIDLWHDYWPISHKVFWQLATDYVGVGHILSYLDVLFPIRLCVNYRNGTKYGMTKLFHFKVMFFLQMHQIITNVHIVDMPWESILSLNVVVWHLHREACQNMTKITRLAVPAHPKTVPSPGPKFGLH